MKRTILAAVLGLSSVAFAHGTKVTLGSVPSAVRSTFQREAEGGKLENLQVKEKNGKNIYMGEIVSGGKDFKLNVAEDGTILNRAEIGSKGESKEMKSDTSKSESKDQDTLDKDRLNRDENAVPRSNDTLPPSDTIPKTDTLPER